MAAMSWKDRFGAGSVMGMSFVAALLFAAGHHAFVSRRLSQRRAADLRWWMLKQYIDT